MNRIAIIILTLGLGLALVLIFTGKPINNSNTSSVSNVEIRDGVQYITINAKAGYTPRVTNATGDIPTKLLMNTENTFDCSASVVIRKANYQDILPRTGETEIDLGTPKKGESIDGLCGMGMYNFELNFN